MTLLLLAEYEIFIKGHGDTPDWEDTCKAVSKEAAARIFAGRAAKHEAGWEAEDLIKYIHAVDDQGGPTRPERRD